MFVELVGRLSRERERERERFIPVKVFNYKNIECIYKIKILTIIIVNCICALSDDSVAPS